MKRSRPLSLFLSVLILISCFTVSVSATSDNNLVDSDLTQWESDNPVTQVTERVINGETCYFIFSDSEQIVDTNLNLRYSLVYEIPNLKVGRSYTFNFHLLSAEEVGSANVYGETALYTGYKNGSATMCIGLGSYDATNDWVNFVDNAYIEINKDNYLSYYGTDISIQFELPNIVNPCIFIYYGDTSTSKIDNWVYFKNIKLIDNSQADEDSFFSRLFEWFQEKFDAIGESFSNLGNKLTELKNSFLDSLSNLGDTIGSFFDEQLEGIKDFFRGFGNLILYFNWEGEYTNPFEREDSPIDKVSAFFDNLIEYVDSIGTSIENVLDSITGGLHIFDEFTSRFPWLKGIAVFCLALIVITRFIGL